MDSRKTTPDDRDERAAENVVRLPRDWLGPREELVPIGSRAGAAETPENDALPPTAASFWDEDGGSLQAPMQAPAGPREPAPEVQSRSGRRRSLPRRRWPIRSPRGRASAVAGVLAVCAVSVIAVIGSSEGGGPNTGDRTTESAAIITSTGVNRARLTTNASVMSEISAQPRSHHVAKRAARSKRPRIHVTKVRLRHRTHRAARPTHGSSEPVQTPVTTTPTPASQPTTPSSSSSSGPSSSPAPGGHTASSSSGHSSAFGASGSLGPGSSPDS
jgi:hypothetical protein